MTDHTGICIVLPATHYGSNELSHCTLAFLGNTDEVDYPKERVIRLMRHLHEMPLWYDRHFGTKESFTTYVSRMDMFGVERDIPAAVLVKGEFVSAIRERTVELLDAYDIPFSTQFEYTPHVSLTTEFGLRPGMPVKLHRPTLWWGNDRPKVINPVYVGAKL